MSEREIGSRCFDIYNKVVKEQKISNIRPLESPETRKVVKPSVLTSEEKATILQSPVWCKIFACEIFCERWEEVEPIILTDVHVACAYAVDFFKGVGWKEAEPIILTNDDAATTYAIKVLDRRWEEAEEIILTSAYSSFRYSHLILNERWHKAEPIILKDPNITTAYMIHHKITDWKEGEKSISRELLASKRYSTTMGDDFFIKPFRNKR